METSTRVSSQSMACIHDQSEDNRVDVDHAMKVRRWT